MEKNDIEIQWDDDLISGIQWIDNQHKKLFNRLTLLLNSILHNKSGAEIGTTVVFLENYVKTHFGTEEQYMLRYGYPEYQKHKKQHDIFNREVKTIKREYVEEGSSKKLAVETIRKIWKWYKCHITESDKKFGRFIKDRKIIDDDLQFATMVEELRCQLDAFSISNTKESRLTVINELREGLNSLELFA